MITENEFKLLCDLQNGHFWQEAEFSGKDEILPNLEDSIEFGDGLPEKWGVDGDTLISKIKGMSDAEGNELRSKIIAFWKDK